ncbi:MAG: type IVB secretion system protein IcmH/DotU [Sinobacteraceae bacterium]|nr:type IVB secretion system protein IcmH/DotU [Nevskiaceae bacterium]
MSGSQTSYGSATTYGSGNARIADFLIGARNPIVQAAAPLLTLGARLASSIQQANIATLRQQAVQEIRAFEDRLRADRVAAEDSLVARYILCTFVDTAIAQTPWGSQGSWAGQSLLVMFHKEVSGGQKFFEIIARLRSDPTRYIDLLELAFICLSLGYEGRYGQDPRGAAHLADLQHELYRIIREQRQLRDEELAPHWRGVEDRRNPIVRHVPWWIVASLGLLVLTGAFILMRERLSLQAEPIKAALVGPVASVDYPEPTRTAAPPHVSRLKELLAPEEKAGHLTVEDLGTKAIVTLSSPDLFKSASAQANPAILPTLHAIALALNQVPGHVMVVGHTDDLPIHSLKYADNFDLSRDRAVAIATELKGALTTPGRLEWRGAGSTQPRYKPADTAENRARNRRVEIIQLLQPESAR